MASIGAAGDVALVIRSGIQRSLLIGCPDGCGDVVSVNLDARSGSAWRLRTKPTLSLYPSVWRDSGCLSHFIISVDHIWWRLPSVRHADVEAAVQDLFAASPDAGLSDLDLIDALDADPWDIRLACERLVKQGELQKVELPNRTIRLRRA
jgi:hypothetical protein